MPPRAGARGGARDASRAGVWMRDRRDFFYPRLFSRHAPRRGGRRRARWRWPCARKRRSPSCRSEGRRPAPPRRTRACERTWSGEVSVARLGREGQCPEAVARTGKNRDPSDLESSDSEKKFERGSVLFFCNLRRSDQITMPDRTDDFYHESHLLHLAVGFPFVAFHGSARSRSADR